MSEKFSYQDYVTDKKFLAEYNSYQNRYKQDIRESDKVVISLVRDLISKRGNTDQRLTLLDVGCSTGNLLLHLKKMLPDLTYMGTDLAESSLEECRANPDLSGVEFQIADLLSLSCGKFDFVTVNAVLYMLSLIHI